MPSKFTLKPLAGKAIAAEFLTLHFTRVTIAAALGASPTKRGCAPLSIVGARLTRTRQVERKSRSETL
jgi:hypothetical protein